jgi:hypothetical protein
VVDLKDKHTLQDVGKQGLAADALRAVDQVLSSLVAASATVASPATVVGSPLTIANVVSSMFDNLPPQEHAQNQLTALMGFTMIRPNTQGFSELLQVVLFFINYVHLNIY